jgi:hypothetical protein
MGPAKSQRDRLVGHGVGNGLVGRIAIALRDAAIVVEQLQRAHRPHYALLKILHKYK